MNDFGDRLPVTGISTIEKRITRGIEVKAYLTDHPVRGSDIIKDIMRTAPVGEKIFISGGILSDGSLVMGQVQIHDDLIEVMKTEKKDIPDFLVQFEIQSEKDSLTPPIITIGRISVRTESVADLEAQKDSVSVLVHGKSIRAEKANTVIYIGKRILPLYFGTWNNLRFDQFIEQIKGKDFTYNPQISVDVYDPQESKVVFDFNTQRLASGTLHSVAAAKLGYGSARNLIVGTKSHDPVVSKIVMFWNNDFSSVEERNRVISALATELKRSGEDEYTILEFSCLSAEIELSLQEILAGKLPSK